MSRKLLAARWLAGFMASLLVGILLLTPSQAEAAWRRGFYGGYWGYPHFWGIGYWGPRYYPYGYYPYGYNPYYAPAYYAPGYAPGYAYVSQPVATVAAAAPAPAPVPSVAAVPQNESFRVFFDFNKSSLTREGAAVVDQAIASAKRNAATRIEVVGATDTVGTGGYNLALSRLRARAVRDYMVAHGIAADEIGLRGVGKSELLVQTGDNVRERQNRRVDIVISGSSTAPEASNAPQQSLSGMIVTPVQTR
jgi:outer membrane protein OmpA-like peptidoglycan-associated protein